jgi:Spy/CpxP family protein refolding chaperone
LRRHEDRTRGGAHLRDKEANAMRRTILAALGTGVLVLVTGVTAGVAQPPPPGERDPGRGWATGEGHREHMARFLGLSDEQQEAIKKLMEDQSGDHQALREKLRKSREALQQALDGANPDPTSVGELAIEAHRLHQQARALRDARDKAVRQLLTPEQKVKFDAMKALRDERMGGPWGGGFGPRPGRGPERP